MLTSWRETPSALLVIWWPVYSLLKGPVMRSFVVFLVISPNKLWNTQWSCLWFEMPWGACDVAVWIYLIMVNIACGEYFPEIQTGPNVRLLRQIHVWCMSRGCYETFTGLKNGRRFAEGIFQLILWQWCGALMYSLICACSLWRHSNGAPIYGVQSYFHMLDIEYLVKAKVNTTIYIFAVKSTNKHIWNNEILYTMIQTNEYICIIDKMGKAGGGYSTFASVSGFHLFTSFTRK